jgi:hypothetical protein
MSRKLAANVLALAMIAVNAHASSDDDPIRFRDRDTEMIVHRGESLANLVAGWNPIDTPRQMNCKSSSGCLIVLAAEADTASAGGGKLCPFVDGVVAKPKCVVTGNATEPVMIRASARVSSGNHTVQTQFNTPNSGGRLGIWQFEYTLYELR